ncbi:hypothetical protein [Leuconostoc gelidum]|uniref:Uncharacterized protein n=1 Tax=Leuconostoc gelidum subsp. gelidum TaxID=1607839 RepID=A0AB35FXY8_LEUGE|nr:hypothetical protein [Leuconostoc gelidum]MBZ6015412.1 hypothetical protein [Leuconostoc gelidum subsp. gelidum]
MFENFTTDNWLTFWSIGIPVFIALLSYIVSLVANFLAKRETNRPIIIISIARHHVNTLFNTELTIKNYGRSTGWIKGVDISPEYLPKDGQDNLEPNGFNKFKNFPLAPNQEITSLIASGTNLQVEFIEERTFTIRYEARFGSMLFKNKLYREKYSIDEKNFPIVFSDGNYTVEKRLETVNKSINDNAAALINTLNNIANKLDSK